MASSSSINYSYDVFLSFRGTDTRNNFTSHLHKALCNYCIRAFIDNRIERGEEITSFLEKIIESVKLSIIVFSSDYASSSFCLDEMLKIMECKEIKAQIVLPIFYKVYPSEDTYEEAFAKHQQSGKDETKVERWRSSFRKALQLAGWHIDDYRNEARVIDEVSEDVLKRLHCQFEGEMKSSPMVGGTSEYHLKLIMQCLMNDEISKVGVWGMGGVGKTTIVTHINNRLLDDNIFSGHIYWVTVSKDSSVSKLQHAIAQAMKLDFCGEANESKRAIKLFNELKRINKFVLILDDVWEPFETEDVGIPLMDGRKLLLTSRSLRVCERMKCEPIQVKPLFEHEAVDLFMKEFKSQINDYDERREIMESIVEECGGLPLAIVVIARTMRGVVEIWKWRNTLRELQKPCEGENPEIEGKVFKVLKFSYDHLPNDMYRQCFLYCSLFPEDYEFKREDLIEYWIGERIIDELGCRQAELDKGNVILDNLVHSSLLESTQIRMHDVIRDMALINAKVGLPFQDPLESVQVVASKTVLQSFPNLAPHCSKLKTLVLQGNYTKEVSGCFFSNMHRLNVLHITDMINLKSIPDFVTNLENLRLLMIARCHTLECIPSLGGLEKLYHLKISRNEGLKEIPKGIERLINLRVLDLSMNGNIRGSFPSGVVEKLSHLQTVDLIGSNVEVESKALISLEKLEILRLHFYNFHKFNCYVNSGHWWRLLNYQINYGASYDENWKRKGMCLRGIRDVCGIFLPNDIQNLRLLEWESSMFNVLKNTTFANLQTISIYKHKSSYLFSVDLAQQLLHNVQELEIYFCDGLEEIIEREEDGSNCVNYPTILLPRLKLLRLYELPELRSIYRGMMLCPSLELIQIQLCDRVERLPFSMEKVGNKQNPAIRLRGFHSLEKPLSRRWWESLQWDDTNTKSMYLQTFDAEI